MTVKRFVAATLSVISISALCLMPMACSSNSPTGPGGPTPTPVPTNPNGPIIVAFFGILNNGVVQNGTCGVYMVDNLGSPVTTAAVTLITPGSSIPITYSGIQTINPPANMGVTNITGGWYTGYLMSYPATQDCSFNVVNAGATYVANFTPLNASAAGVTGASGVTFLWSNPGNKTLVQVTGYDYFQNGPPLTSPYSIPASSFPYDPAGAGNDTVRLYVFQVNSPAFSGCQSSSVVGTGYEVALNY